MTLGCDCVNMKCYLFSALKICPDVTELYSWESEAVNDDHIKVRSLLFLDKHVRMLDFVTPGLFMAEKKW